MNSILFKEILLYNSFALFILLVLFIIKNKEDILEDNKELFDDSSNILYNKLKFGA